MAWVIVEPILTSKITPGSIKSNSQNNVGVWRFTFCLNGTFYYLRNRATLFSSSFIYIEEGAIYLGR